MVNLVIVIVVTRGLDTKAAGAVFALTSVYFIAETAVRLGTDVGIVHFVASRRPDDPGSVMDVVTASFIPVLPAMLVGGVAVGLLTPVVVHSLGGGQGITHVGTIAVVLGVFVPIGATYDFMTATTRGLGTSRPTVFVERIIRPALQILGVTVAVATGHDAAWVAAAWVVPYLVTAPIMAWWLRSLLRAHERAAKPSGWRTIFRQVWRFTLPRSLTSVLQILLQRLDIVIVGAILGARDAAIYTGATRFVVVGQLGSQALSFVFQPQLARLMSRRKVAEAKDLFKVSTTWLIGLNAPLFLTICVGAPVLVKLLGPRYHDGITAMIIVTGASLVGSACGPVDYVLITVGRTSWTLFNTVAALTLNLVIDLVFIPRIGINAAAIGWAAAIGATNVLPVLQVRRAVGFSPFSRNWVRIIVTAGLAYGVVPGLVELVVGPSLTAIAATLVVTSTAYLWMIWTWRADLGLAQLAPGRRTAGSLTS